MSTCLVTHGLLGAAEEELHAIMQALISAHPERLEQAQKMLQGLVSTLGAIEASARQKAASVSQQDLMVFQNQLKRVGNVTRQALAAIERHGGLPDSLEGSGGKMQFAA